MAADDPAETPPTPVAKPKKRVAAKSVPDEAPAQPGPKATKESPTSSKDEADDEPPAPRRAGLSDDRRRLLSLRRALDKKRPIFGRQAANRYWRIGRDESWRRPRGLQSKQRRHYGYRTQIVSIGYRSPAKVRGLVPSGFRPILVRTPDDLEHLDAKTEAAIIARTVGTRRRLTLEEAARKLGVHVLNPIVKSEREA
ncbi:MAG TPA: 50S ribosomal protein L32e [Thermoplasmata archaeon]|nr:50S ribosomal protein L32e [Thermoplasmata archaeon]